METETITETNKTKITTKLHSQPLPPYRREVREKEKEPPKILMDGQIDEFQFIPTDSHPYYNYNYLL